MQPEPEQPPSAGERPIGLPASLRAEAKARFRPRGRDGGAISKAPRRGEGLPLWAIIFMTATALLAASWLAVMASVTLRLLGWF